MHLFSHKKEFALCKKALAFRSTNVLFFRTDNFYDQKINSELDLRIEMIQTL